MKFIKADLIYWAGQAFAGNLIHPFYVCCSCSSSCSSSYKKSCSSTRGTTEPVISFLCWLCPSLIGIDVPLTHFKIKFFFYEIVTLGEKIWKNEISQWVKCSMWLRRSQPNFICPCFVCQKYYQNVKIMWWGSEFHQKLEYVHWKFQWNIKANAIMKYTR